jgi:hypothetical protein
VKDAYKVIWLCKAKKAQKSFIFTDFVDDKVMNRVVFIDEDTDNVLTLTGDSYYWMITRPNRIDLNDN